jgi:hypothetical protein
LPAIAVTGERRNAMKTSVMICCTAWLLLLAAVAMADEPAVSGVFGLAPLDEGAALAVWVPLDTEESITGVRWYNNDGETVFPEILAVAGDPGEPSVLDDAVVVAEAVSGGSLAWSEASFAPAVASATPGLYLIFRLPLGGDFECEGSGAGLGYEVGDGQIRSWISTVPGKWSPLSADYQMAVEAVIGGDKSGGVLVLGGKGRPEAEEHDAPGALPAVATLRAAPNPFNPQTEIQFTLPRAEEVRLVIFDVRGRTVRTLVSGSLEAGAHAVAWNGRSDAGRAQPSGVYLALLEAGPIRMTQRLTLVQ